MILATLSDNTVSDGEIVEGVENGENPEENEETESGDSPEDESVDTDDGEASNNLPPATGGGSGDNGQAVTSGDSPDAETGGGGSESETSEKLDEVLEQLEIVKQSGGGENQAFTDFAESFDDLVKLLSAKVDEPVISVSAYPVLPEKYQDFSYPITVQFEVLEAGDSYSMFMNFSCSRASLFADEIASYTAELDSGKYDFVCTQYVWDKDNVLVYDYEHAVIEDEKEEPTETELTEIELLESINTELQAIRENEILHHEEIKQLLGEQAAVSGGIYSAVIGVGFATFLGVGFTIANNFWSRMKVG